MLKQNTSKAMNPYFQHAQLINKMKQTFKKWGVLTMLGLEITASVAGQSTSVTLAQKPLNLPNGTTPNVLMVFDTSYSMLFDASNTSELGIDNENSKARIAYNAVGSFLDSNVGKINFGLMSYRYRGAAMEVVWNDWDAIESPSNNAVDRIGLPFRLNAYPTGNGGIGDAPNAPNQSDKRNYTFKAGELIHYRFAVMNRGPEEAINPRIKLYLPKNIVMNGFDRTARTYRSVPGGNALQNSGFDFQYSQQTNGTMTCHSPTEDKINSSFSTPGAYRGGAKGDDSDGTVFCDLNKLKVGETVYLETYMYWSGLGAGVMGNMEIAVADTQCDTDSQCNAITWTSNPNQTRNPGLLQGEKWIRYNLVSNRGLAPALINSIGLAKILPGTKTLAAGANASSIYYYFYISNNTLSSFNGTLSLDISLDNSFSGTTRIKTTNLARQVTYTPGTCGAIPTGSDNVSYEGCYTEMAGPAWSCVQKTAPEIGWTCTRSSGMPSNTHPEDFLNYGEIIQVKAESTRDWIEAIGEAQFSNSALVSSSQDYSHVIDPGVNAGSFNQGASYEALSAGLSSCPFWMYLDGQKVKSTQDGGADVITGQRITAYEQVCAPYFGNTDLLPNVARSAARGDGPTDYDTYPTAGDGVLEVAMQPLTSTLKDNLISTTVGKFAINRGGDKVNTKYGGSNNGLQFFYSTPIAGTLKTAKEYLQNKVVNDQNNKTGLLESQLRSSWPSSCGASAVILITDGDGTVNPEGGKYPGVVVAKEDAKEKAQELLTAGIKTFVIALGSGASLTNAQEIASAGGGSAYGANDVSSLTSALSAIINEIGGTTGLSGVTLGGSSGSDKYLTRSTFDWGRWTGNLQLYTLNASSITPENGLDLMFNPNSSYSHVYTSEGGSVKNWAWNSTANTRRNLFMAAKPSPAAGNSAALNQSQKGVVFPTTTLSAPSSLNVSISTTTPQLYAWQVDALNKNASGTTDGRGLERLEWLRGNRANEVDGSAGTNWFRKRGDNFLGDIINSAPLFVGAPSDGTISEASYATFRANNASRDLMVYFGGNDGLFHGARIVSKTHGLALNDKATLVEQFAVMPSFMMGHLPKLMDKDYVKSDGHQYYMDATPVAKDILIDDTNGVWKTYVVAGAGAGGRGYIGLDVTNANAGSGGTNAGSFQEYPSGSTTNGMVNANNLIKWEFTSENSTNSTLGSNGVPSSFAGVNGDSDLGFTIGKPLMGRVFRGGGNSFPRPVVIFGNGYNNTDSSRGRPSSTGEAALYIIDAETGFLIRKIAIPGIGSTSAPNGLGSPVGVDTNRDGKIDRVYAGDLYGNLWRFNLYGSNGVSDTSYTAWTIAFNGKPLFKATNGEGSPRAITGEIKVAFNPTKGYNIIFGTGRYLGSEDVKSAYDSSDSDGIYSIWDRDDSTPIEVSGLSDARKLLSHNEVKQCAKIATAGSNVATNSCTTGSNSSGMNPYVITGPTSTEASLVSTTPSKDAFCTSTPGFSGGSRTCKMGCFIELKNIPGAGYFGERSIFSPSVAGKAVQFNTIIPPVNVCSETDKGITVEYLFDYLSCNALAKNPYDVTRDNQFTLEDYIKDAEDAKLSPSGQLMSGLVPPGATVIKYNGSSVTYDASSDQTTEIQSSNFYIEGATGRVSWREIQPQNVKP